MERETVDFGIDLGTTNSAVARAGATGAAIIKNRFQSDTTPSVVARTRSGQMLVGQDALNKPNLSPIAKFKRQMGASSRFNLADGSEWSPEQLSAEVLKELKAAVSQRFDQDLVSAVITIPAMFQQPQCEATHQAATLAGIDAALLLQEPIAAATWYLNEAQKAGHYVVYDLGGGTFDVSVVRLKDNEMSVIAHGGDNYLGGSDFDRHVAEWVVEQIERRHGRFPELESGAKKFILARESERARIALSSAADATIDLSDLDLPIFEIPLSRGTLQELIMKDVDRTIRLIKDRLEQASLRPADVERLILVGGPTMTPLIRQKLKELGMPVATDQDPMTVVALGAAVHASALLRKDRSSRANAASSAARITLHYDPVAPDVFASISGRVEFPAGFQGEIRLETVSRDWDSGWVNLRNGGFVLELPLRPGTVNEFALSLRDIRGTAVVCAPSTVSIRNGVAAAAPITPYEYGVALDDGSLKVIVPKGQAIPAVGSTTVQLAKDLFAGADESCPIYFLEGASRIAADNALVGKIEIKGEDLPRRLRQGEKIEIRIRMDESRRLTARVFIPILDLEYAIELKSRLDTPDVHDIEQSLSETNLLIKSVNDVVSEQDIDQLSVVSRDVEIIEADVERAKTGDIDAANSSLNRLSAIKANLRDLSAKYGAQRAHRQAIGEIEDAERICDQFEDRLGASTLSDLRNDAERYLRSDNVKALEAVRERAETIFWQHYVKTPECWIQWMEWLRSQRRYATHDHEYDEYLKRAEGCLSRHDFEGVRLNGLKASSYLPDERQKENRFSDTLIQR